MGDGTEREGCECGVGMRRAASGDRKGSGTEDFTSLPFDTALNVLGMFG